MESSPLRDSIPYITCYCGLARLLPVDITLEPGSKIHLPICPRCGASFDGYVDEDGIIVIP